MWSQYDENLNENPFFQEIISKNHDIIKRATEEAWIICVPRIGNLEACQVTIDVILDHILICDSDNPGHYRTLSKKEVAVSNKQIIIENDPTRALNNVQILFEETHYTEEKLKYTVWCIDKTLFCDSKTCTVLHHNLDTIHDCIDFLWCESLGHSIFEQIQKVVTTFLEKNDEFEFETLQTQKEMLGSVYSHCLQVALKNEHLDKKSQDDCFLNKLQLAVETYMQSCLSEKLLFTIGTSMCEFDAHLNKIVQNSSEIQLKDLDISTNFCDVITSAKCELNNFNRFKTVIDKIRCLKCTFQVITSSGRTMPEKEYISSDILLQIFIFIILKLRINNWVANLTYIKKFNFNNTDNSSENSFLVSTLEAALQYIRSNDFLDRRANLVYNDANNENIDNPIIASAFEYVCLGQLENLIQLLNKNITYEKPQKTLCHPLCSCENCIKHVVEDHFCNNLTIACRNDKEQTLLHLASLYGHCDIVEYLINENADVNAKDFLGRTSLHYATVEGLQGVLLLLSNCQNVDVNVKDNNGNSPLILCANNGHDSCVKALVYASKDIDINSCNNYGDTALHLASKWGYVSVVQILLENSASPNMKNKRNQTAIDVAHNAYITRLLTQFSQDQTVSSWPDNILGHSEALDFNPGFKIVENHFDKDYGIKPKNVEQVKKIDLLLKAIINNDLPLTCFYLGFCTANPAVGDYAVEKKCHPLCTCDKCFVLEKEYEIISLPRQSEYINVNFCDCNGYTPLHAAAVYGRTEILRLLLDSGALPNLKTFETLQTPLLLAAIHQRLQVAKVLLSTSGCEVNARDGLGNTALYYSCINNDVRIAELLLSNGADYSYKNNEGKTITEEIQDKMLYRIYKLLRNYSGDKLEKYSNENLFI